MVRNDFLKRRKNKLLEDIPLDNNLLTDKETDNEGNQFSFRANFIENRENVG